MKSAHTNRPLTKTVSAVIVVIAVAVTLIVGFRSSAQKARSAGLPAPQSKQIEPVSQPPVQIQTAAQQSSQDMSGVASRASASMRVASSGPREAEPATMVRQDSSPDLVTVGTYPFTNSTGVALEDMSSGTTQLVAASLDDTASAVTNIGFDFWYDGVRATQFSANANGLIRLGGTAVSTGFTNSLGSTTDAPKIASYWDDISTGTNGKVHYKVIGSAPNRKLIVEFQNMNVPRAGGAGTFAPAAGAATFQAWLFETTGVIEFVYGSGIALNSVNSGYSVGLQSGAATNIASVTTTGPTVSYAAANDTQSNAITSGAAYIFTPNTPAAPTGFSATAVTATSMTLNWTDIATNEFGYAVYQSNDGGTTYNFVTQAAANATSQSISSLNPSTTYFFKIFAVTEGAMSSALTGNQTTSAAGSISSTVVGGNWSSTLTWVGGVVPTVNDNVTIVDGATVTIDVTTAVALNVTVGQGASGILQYISTPTSTLTVGQSVTVSANGTFQSAAALAITHSLVVGTNLTNNGTLDFSTNANTASATITFTGANNNTFGGTGATTDIKSIVINKGTSNANILELTPSNFTVQGVTTDVAGFLTLTNGTLKVSGTFSVTNRVFTAAGYTIGATTGFWLNNPNFTVAGQNGSPTETGLLRISQGTFNVGTATGNSMGFSSGSTITVEGGNVNCTSRFGVAAAGNTVTYTQSGGTITVDTIGNISTTLASFDLGTSTSTLVNMSGGTIIVQLAGTGASGPKDYRFDGGNGPAGLTGGTVQFGNAASGAAKAFNIRGNVPNLVIDSTSAGHSATFDNTLTNFFDTSLNITIGVGATLNLNGSATSTFFFMEGSTLTNNGTLTATNANKRMYWAGSTAQTFTGSGVVTAAMNSLELDNVNGMTLTTTNQIPTLRVILFNGSISGAGKLTLGNGGATAGTFQIGNTTTPTAAGTLDASPTFNLGSGGEVINYLRTTTDRNTGPEIQPSRSITTLNVDPNGINVNLVGDLTVTGVTTLTTGNFNIGANKLTVTNAIAGTPTFLFGGATSSLQLNGTVASNVPSSITQLNNFTLNNTGGSTQQVSPFTVNGTFALTNGNYTIGARTLNLNGLITVGTGTLTGGGSSQIAIGGSGAQVTLPAVSGGLLSLTVNRNGGCALGAPLSIAASGTLALIDGVLDNGINGLTMGNLSLIRRDSNGSFTTAAPTFSGLVNLSYLGLASGSTWLEVPANPAALRILETNWTQLSLNSNVTINQQFILDSGVIFTFASTLKVAGGATVTRTAGWVYGYYAREFNSAALFTYDLGDNSGNYSPMTVSPTNGSFPTTLTIYVAVATISGLNPSDTLQRQWVVSSSGITKASLTFNYVPGDNPGANTAIWRVVRKLDNDQRFTFPNGFTDNVTEGSNTATASNITMPAFGGKYSITQSNAPAVRFGDPRPAEVFDFQGNDSRTDVSVWNGTSGVWNFINSSDDVQTSSNPWGSTALGDHVVPGDYDGDGITDLAVWRDTDFNWFIVKSSNGLGQAINWGGFGDKTVPGDYDGDGKTDVAVFRPSEGNWYILRSSDNTVVVRNWGAASDYLVQADYDGDGKTDIAVFRPSEGNWYVVKSSNSSVSVTSWGTTGDNIVPGDYDGDGRSDFAIFRPSEGNWYVINSGDNSVTVRNWGTTGDNLVPGDYDRDGRIDFAVYRPSEGNWYIVNSGDGTLTLRNLSGGVIVPAAYVQP